MNKRFQFNLPKVSDALNGIVAFGIAWLAMDSSAATNQSVKTLDY